MNNTYPASLHAHSRGFGRSVGVSIPGAGASCGGTVFVAIPARLRSVSARPGNGGTAPGLRRPPRRAGGPAPTSSSSFGLRERRGLEPRDLRVGIHPPRRLHEVVHLRLILYPLLVQDHGRHEEVVVLHVLDGEVDVLLALDCEVLRVGPDDLFLVLLPFLDAPLPQIEEEGDLIRMAVVPIRTCDEVVSVQALVAGRVLLL